MGSANESDVGPLMNPLWATLNAYVARTWDVLGFRQNSRAYVAFIRVPPNSRAYVACIRVPPNSRAAGHHVDVIISTSPRLEWRNVIGGVTLTALQSRL